MKQFDVYIVGLGGQGVLTIGDLLSRAAMNKGMDVNFYPSKGMSQRGGFVQGQLRFGRPECGPSLTPGNADLVVSMERSESLKGVRFAKKGGDFLLHNRLYLLDPPLAHSSILLTSLLLLKSHEYAIV